MVPVLLQIAANPAEAARIQTAILGGALRERREDLKLRLMAAGVGPAEAEELLWQAIDSVPGGAWCKAAVPGRLLVQAVDAVLERRAARVKWPYRPLLAALRRQWETMSSLMTEIGLTESSRVRLILNVVLSFTGWEGKPGQALDGLLLERCDQACADRAARMHLAYRGLGRSRSDRPPDRVLLMLENVTLAQERRRKICRFFDALEELVEAGSRLSGHENSKSPVLA